MSQLNRFWIAKNTHKNDQILECVNLLGKVFK